MKERLSEVRTFQCPACNNIFQRRIFFKDKERRRYCSVKCKNIDGVSHKWSDERKIKYANQMKGENNPNYGNKWSEEDKQKASDRVKTLYELHPEYREIAGSANRGVKFDDARRKNISLGKLGIPGKPHSIESRKKIGIKSKEKWTTEYLDSYRGVMESLGYWTPRECKSEFELYYEEANWIGNMVQYFSTDELKSLNQFGIFNPYSNTKGYVRDHIFPRIWGFLLKVSPKILRHPVNIAFISHADNIRKGFCDRRTDINEIKSKLIQLMLEIKNYKGQWHEQEDCLYEIEKLEAIGEIGTC